MKMIRRFLLMLFICQITSIVYANTNAIWKMSEGPNLDFSGIFQKIGGNMPEIFQATMLTNQNVKITYKVFSYRIGNKLFLMRKNSSDGNDCLYEAVVKNLTEIEGKGYCDDGGKPLLKGRMIS